MALLAFSAFLLCDELIKIRACDMNFNACSMSIKLPRSKTNKYRDGDSVLVACSGIQTYPVAMLERYYEKAEIEHSSNKFIF